MQSGCRPAISSMSLGYASAGHALSTKLQVAALNGFKGVEMFFDDLKTHAQDTHGSTSKKALLEAAGSIYNDLCEPYGLQIICLQPFRHYEGLYDRTAHASQLVELRFWIQLAKALHTDLIAMASSFLSLDRCSPETDLIVKDLQEAAEICRAEDIRLSFEALCWGTHIDTWEASWAIVHQVDRPNFGLCLDTFNIAGRIFADPASSRGVREHGDEELSTSMGRLMNKVDVSKIFYVQVVDAEMLDQPLKDEGHPMYVSGQPARMTWSRNCRVFYGEGYLPIDRIARAIFDGLQYQGWVSMELFNKSCATEGSQVIQEHARRGMTSWEALRDDMRMTPGSDFEEHFTAPMAHSEAPCSVSVV